MRKREAKESVRIRGLSPALALTALLGAGCAPVAQLLAAFETAPPRHLEAQGPGTVFGSIECAAVDALIYAHLQIQTARDARVRGGTIYRTGAGYTYDEPVVAGPLLPEQISYVLTPRDVARFHLYPRVGNHAENRRSEVPWRSDRRSVRFVDPLHRPIYILHPSLAIRVYRGKDHELVEVANLRRPVQPQTLASAGPTRVPGMCHQAAVSIAEARGGQPAQSQLPIRRNGAQ